ncbi:MAG: AGE family epimerase/isomerase, partial [Chitinophagaceae bacterium]|nr:AGE family epimerase/isomerase [Chitinophagaceae bacterium]
LYTIWPDESLREKLAELIDLFLTRIIHPQTHHLVLFFNEQWARRSTVISYGHDIEAAWLLQEAAEIIGDEALIAKVKIRSVLVADAASRGLDGDGGLWYEYDKQNNHLIAEKHAWPQAEAMVGFYNAWQTTGKTSYLEKSLASWTFIRQYILDNEKGEWYWGVMDNNLHMKGQDKVGLWKCPYHNSRACMEIISRVQPQKRTTNTPVRNP